MRVLLDIKITYMATKSNKLAYPNIATKQEPTLV